ncbi:MAG TPA: hypothetical protein VHT52_21750 [Stellaceae bacterium]|jgi:hypothetical protein|nr:hypothetical protein [Stellaceae bacterium]
MHRWLKKRIALWLARMIEVDPRMFVPWTIVAKEVEVRIVGKRIWIDTETGCQFRATALNAVTVTDERNSVTEATDPPAIH